MPKVNLIAKLVISILAAVGAYLIIGPFIDRLMEGSKQARNESENTDDFEEDSSTFTDLQEEIARNFPPGNGKAKEKVGANLKI